MASRYDTRNLHGLGGRSEELQVVMDLVESDIAAKAASTQVALDIAAAIATAEQLAVDVVSTTADSTLGDGVDIAVGTSTGTNIGTAANQKIGLYGVTPVVQPTHVADIVLSATTGELPAAADAQVFADTAMPTVVELLGAVVSLNAKITAINARMAALGSTAAS
jgi:hypothetical protein